MSPLIQLSRHGQSYWLDNLTRKMIHSGELKQRVHEQGLRGITSNPRTFRKAIAGSREYEEQIDHLVREGRSAQDIYETLAVSDVREACDLLRPVYDDTEGVDGYVSLEVSAYLAHDTRGTMEEARRLWNAVGRPNLFIKVPGTSAGVPAIEELLYQGINVNITLLFGIPDYEAVARAYVRALTRRVREDKPIHGVASVASFFLSRIDVLVDQLLSHRIHLDHNWTRPQEDGPGSKTTPLPPFGKQGPRAETLLGRTAIANAKLAYQSFRSIFRGPDWDALQARGARVQRPLWASTSPKNPLYDDVRYVEPLIGRDTVNTMPAKTIAAFMDHGRVEPDTVEQGVSEARKVLDDLVEIGIDLDKVVWQLQNEGVQKFIAPYDDLLEHLCDRRQQVLGTQINQQRLTPGFLGEEFSSLCSALHQRQWGSRLFNRDLSLWNDEVEAEHRRSQLAWVDAIPTFQERAKEIDLFAEETRADDFRHLVLLGDKYLRGWVNVWRQMIEQVDGRPTLIIPNDLGLGTLRALEATVDLQRTFFVVADYPETGMVLDAYHYHHFANRLGPEGTQQFVAVTNPGSPLLHETREDAFRRCFENPEAFTGPFTGLSYFGLVPLALLGVDVVRLLQRAEQQRLSCGPSVPAASNPGITLGVLLATAARRGLPITLASAEALSPFRTWVRDLLVDDHPPGLGLTVEEMNTTDTPRNHDQGRVFVFLQLAEDGGGSPEPLLAQPDQPTVTITLPGSIERGANGGTSWRESPEEPAESSPNPGQALPGSPSTTFPPFELGGEFFRWQVAMATAGSILGRYPFATSDLRGE